MTPLTFVDTHNMVVFLSKSDASAGFDQIVDFLNAQVIQYALMINPTIYVSCIKQLWATTSIKKDNDVVKLQALIDGKNVVVTKDVIRQDLYFDDADGVECLPNEDIFAEVARMGYEKPPLKLTFYKAFFSAQWKFLIHILVQCISAKRTAWNEFSCSMASAVICLATGRKFNFSKYIFDSMVRNMDSPSKFLIIRKGFLGVETPLFASMLVQPQAAKWKKKLKCLLLLRMHPNRRKIEAIDADEDITLVDAETQEEVENLTSLMDDLSSHTTRYTSPTLTQKVFANMRRIRKGFLGVETPLFASMLVQPQAAKVEEEVEVPTAPAPPSPTHVLSPPPQDPNPTPHASPPSPP
nr:hypothetical protein [Tanacetum cinerariifolium]